MAAMTRRKFVKVGASGLALATIPAVFNDGAVTVTAPE